MIQVLIILMNMCICFMTAIVFHELGHILYYKSIIKKDPEMVIRRNRLAFDIVVKYDPSLLTVEKEKELITAGIVLGLVTLFISSFVLSVEYYLLALIPVYLYGCMWDFKRLWGLRNGY